MSGTKENTSTEEDVNGSIGINKYTFFEVRYSINEDEPRKLKIELLLDSDWEKLTRIIGNSLGCNSSVITSLTMIGGNDGMKSPPLTTAAKFWKFFSYYNYEQADYFEVQLSEPLTFHENKLPKQIINTVHTEEITSPGDDIDNIPIKNADFLPEITPSQIYILPTPVSGTLGAVGIGIHNEMPTIADCTTNLETPDSSQPYRVTSISDEIINENVDSFQLSLQSPQLNSSPIQATNATSSPDLDGAMKSMKVILRCSYKTTPSISDTNTSNSIVSDITVNRLCTWNELTDTITETIFQKNAKINSFLLIDSDGYEVSGLLTTAEMFWKTYQKNRHNKNDTSFQIDYTIIASTSEEVKKVALEDMKEVAKARARKKIEDDIRQRAMEREKDKVNQTENSPGKSSPIALPTSTTTSATTAVATKSNASQNGKHDHSSMNRSNGKGNPMLRTPPRKSNSLAKSSVEPTIASPPNTSTTTPPTTITTPPKRNTALTAKEKIAEDIRLRALERGKEKQKRLSGAAELSPEKESVTSPAPSVTSPAPSVTTPTSTPTTSTSPDAATTTSITPSAGSTPSAATTPSATITSTNVTLTPTKHAIDENGIISPSSSFHASNSKNHDTQTPKTPPRISKYSVSPAHTPNRSPVTPTRISLDKTMIDTNILSSSHMEEPTGTTPPRSSSIEKELKQHSSSSNTLSVIESIISSHPVTITEIQDEQQRQEFSDNDTTSGINDNRNLGEEVHAVESMDISTSTTSNQLVDIIITNTTSSQSTFEFVATNVSTTHPSDNSDDTVSSQTSIHINNEELVIVDGQDLEYSTMTITPPMDILQTETQTNILSEEVVTIAIENIEKYSVLDYENDIKLIDEQEDIVMNMTVVEPSLLSDIHFGTHVINNLTTVETTATIEDESSHFLDISNASSSSNTNTSNISTTSSSNNSANKYLDNLEDPNIDNNNIIINDINDYTMTITTSNSHISSSLSTNKTEEYHYPTQKVQSFPFYLNDDITTEITILITMTMTWSELLERLSTFFSLSTSNQTSSGGGSGSRISHLILQDLDYDDVSPQLRTMEKFLKFIKKYQSGDGVKIQVHTVMDTSNMIADIEGDTITSTISPAIESNMDYTTVLFTSDEVNYQPVEQEVEEMSTREPSTSATYLATTTAYTTTTTTTTTTVEAATAATLPETSIEVFPTSSTTLSIEEIINLKANFLRACGDGDLALATTLYHQGKSYEILDMIDSKGMTALHYACDGMHIEIVVFLIDCGANIFLEDGSGLTPLHCICLQGLMSLSHLLTPDTITLKSSSGLTLLHCASNGGHEDILLHLLKYDNNVHNKDKEGLTPLHHACLNGHLSIAKILVENNASINSRDLAGMSPLLYACSEGNLAIVEWLIDIGANVHAKNNFGDGALHIASQGGYKEVVQFLLPVLQMKKDEKNNNNETASDLARSRNYFEVADLITQYGITPEVPSIDEVLDPTPPTITSSIPSMSTTTIVSEAEVIVDLNAVNNYISEVIADVSVESHPVVEETSTAVRVSEYHQQQPKEISTVIIYTSTLSPAEKQIFRLTDVQSYSPLDTSPEILADKELLFRYSCYTGDTLKVESMITEGMDVNKSTINGTNPLHYACAGGHFDTAYILVHHGAKINHSNHDGCTALHFSCYFQHDDISIWLLEQGSNINIKNKHGYSPLYFIYALNQLHLLRIIMNDLKGVVPLEFEKNKSLLHLIVQFNYKEMVTLVIQSGYGNATSVDDDLCTPLHYACQYGQLEIVQYLILNYGASINNKDSLGNNALFRACASGNTNLIIWLVQEGASLQGTDYAGNTCLHVASRSGKKQIVEWLLQQEVNALLKNNDGYTARDLALQCGFADICSLLPVEEVIQEVNPIVFEETNLTMTSTSQPLAAIVEEETENEEYFGAQPREEDNEDHSDPFVQFKRLCVEGDMEAVVHAIQVDGVNPNLTNKKGSTALHFLSLSGNLKLCRKLVELGASPNKSNDRGLTPLLCACINGNLAVVKWLAQQPDVTLTDISEDGRSALHHGCYNGHVNITEWLLKENIDVNIYSREGNLAFHDACIAGHVPVVSSLINYGMNVSTINQYGFAPVTLAMEQGHLDVVKILVINGADVNAVDNHNRTIFLYACGKGYLDFAQWLVRTSKEVNVRAVGGVSDKLNTGLHTAVKYGHLEMIKWLLEIGLDVNALNEKQQTPIAIANAYQYFEISKLLILKRFSVYEDFRNYSKFAEFQVALKTINLPMMNEIISEFAVKIKSVFNLIHYAAATGNVTLINLLIEKKEYVNCKTNMGHTPLHYAAVKDHVITAKKLMEFGADLEERDLEGCTPLVLAMYAGNAEVSKLLFNTRKKEVLDMAGLVATLSAGSEKKSAKNNRSSKVVKNPILRAIAFAKGPMKGCTVADDNDDHDLETTSVLSIFSCITSRSIKEESLPPPPSAPTSPEPPKQHKHVEDSPRTSHSMLMKASQRHVKKLFEIIPEEGGIDEFDFSGPPLSQAMITACQSNDLESLRHFVSQGVNVNLRNPSNASTFLHFASMRGHLAIVEYLIEEGALVNLRNISGMSPLHIACERKHGEMILLLVRHGADVMIRNRAGETPLHCLCARGLGDIFREVLSIATSDDYLHHEKVKMEVTTNKGLTLLHTAVEYGAVDVVVFLLSLQVEVNPVDDENRAPIHFACLKGNLTITELLWDRGAAMNARDTKGRTPFLYACVGGHLSLMEWLCERGADPNAMTDAGNNALHAACRLGDLDMVRWLVEKGINPNHPNRQNVTPKLCALEAGKLDVIHWLENGIVLLPVGQE